MVGQLFKIRLLALVAIAVVAVATPGLAQNTRRLPATRPTSRPRIPRRAGGARTQERYAYHSQISNPSARCAGAGLRGSLRCLRLLRRRRLPGDLPDWQIELIHTPGSYSLAARRSASPTHLQRRGRLPGHVPVQRHRAIVSDVAATSCRAAVDVLSSCARHLLGVGGGRMDYHPNGQWWSAPSRDHGTIARWINPGDGWLTGCTSWSSCPLTVVDSPTGTCRSSSSPMSSPFSHLLGRLRVRRRFVWSVTVPSGKVEAQEPSGRRRARPGLCFGARRQ